VRTASGPIFSRWIWTGIAVSVHGDGLNVCRLRRLGLKGRFQRAICYTPDGNAGWSARALRKHVLAKGFSFGITACWGRRYYLAADDWSEAEAEIDMASLDPKRIWRTDDHEYARARTKSVGARLYLHIRTKERPACRPLRTSPPMTVKPPVARQFGMGWLGTSRLFLPHWL